MTEVEKSYISDLIDRYPRLAPIEDDIYNAYALIRDCYKNDGKLLVAGNGGSAADSEHIVGELMKSFELPRPLPKEVKDRLAQVDNSMGRELADNLEEGLPAIALTTHEALTTAYANDVNGSLSVAQQLNGYGRKGDVFLGISTSGNSKNILYASVLAKAKGISVIALSGRDGGELKKYSDIDVIVPEHVTYKIQELHLPIYHCWCRMLEKNREKET